MDTERLLERAQSGDTSAVDQLLRTHYSAIHSVCHRMLLSRESADDAVQNALIAIVKGLPRFDGKAALSTWIYRIATNSAIDEIRRIRRHGGSVPLNDAASAHTVASDHVVDPTAVLAEHLVDSSRVAQALGSLPDEFRAAVVLRYISDLDYAEIAAVLEVPVGTVRSRLARGKKLLAEKLADPTTLSPPDEPNLGTPSSLPPGSSS
jgi:RNA polymerase sigma-70 factor (ECF subfamily)